MPDIKKQLQNECNNTEQWRLANKQLKEQLHQLLNNPDFAHQKNCGICGELISKAIDEISAINVKGARLVWLCNDCEAILGVATKKEIQQLKEELDLERSKKGKYTKFGGGNRSNSCEFEIHGIKCEHGDCDCTCHDGEQDSKTNENIVKRLKDEIEMHKHQIKVIQNRYDESTIKDESYLETIFKHRQSVEEFQSILKEK